VSTLTVTGSSKTSGGGSGTYAPGRRPEGTSEVEEGVFEDAVLQDGGAPKSKRFLTPSSVMAWDGGDWGQLRRSVESSRIRMECAGFGHR